jgi:signal transduction histidine kinase
MKPISQQDWFGAIVAVLLLSLLIYSHYFRLLYLKRVNMRLRNLDTLKEHFLANSSHELRTPLNGILGLAESMSSNSAEQSAAETQEKAQMILASGARLGQIAKDMLTLSQLNRSELSPRLITLDLHQLAARVIAELEPLWSAKALRLANQIPPERQVLADAEFLTEMLHRLMANAIKFTQQGSITLSHRQDQDYDIIAVGDTGIGIAAADIAGLATQFQQLESSASRRAEGAGLGLAIVQKLLELQGGKLKIESVLGQGSQFQLCLPHGGRPKAGSAKTHESVPGSASL